MPESKWSFLAWEIKDDRHPNGDIEIKFTELKPAEKLYEELLIGDKQERAEHPKIIPASEPFIPLAELRIELDALHLALADNNMSAIKSRLKRLVVGYSG